MMMTMTIIAASDDLDEFSQWQWNDVDSREQESSISKENVIIRKLAFLFIQQTDRFLLDVVASCSYCYSASSIPLVCFCYCNGKSHVIIVRNCFLLTVASCWLPVASQLHSTFYSEMLKEKLFSYQSQPGSKIGILKLDFSQDWKKK